MFTYMEKQAYDHYYEVGRQLAFYKLAKKDKPPAKQVMSFPPKKITPSKGVRGIVGDKETPTSEKLEILGDLYDYDTSAAEVDAIMSKGRKTVTNLNELKKSISGAKELPSVHRTKPVVKPRAKGPVNFYGERISPTIPVPNKTDRVIKETQGRFGRLKSDSKNSISEIRSNMRSMYDLLGEDAQKILGPNYMLPKKKIPKVEKPRNDTKATFGRMQPMKMSK
jgi:hypothetical protein